VPSQAAPCATPPCRELSAPLSCRPMLSPPPSAMLSLSLQAQLLGELSPLPGLVDPRDLGLPSSSVRAPSFLLLTESWAQEGVTFGGSRFPVLFLSSLLALFPRPWSETLGKCVALKLSNDCLENTSHDESCQDLLLEHRDNCCGTN
jgi:hypothetical protein